MNQQFGAIQKLGQDSFNAALKARICGSTRIDPSSFIWTLELPAKIEMDA